MVHAKGGRGRPSDRSKHRLMVDSSALMALFDPSDQSLHRRAVTFRDSFILRYDVQLFTTDYIYSEAMSHLTHLPIETLQRIDAIIRTPPVGDPLKMNQLLVTKAIVQKAIPIYFKYLEHDFSITDCTTFVLMMSHNINLVFTFDDDYKIYTYQRGYESQKRGFWKLPEMLKTYMSIQAPFVAVK